jgi:hypothetical protein
MPTIIQIAAKVDALEKMVNNLSIKSKDEAQPKAPRNMTDKGATHKAKILFYQDNKNNTTIKEKTKDTYGEELAPTFQNYPKVKKCSDIMFAALPTNEKEKYLIKAKASMNK